MSRPASAQSIGGLSSLNTSDVTLDMTKRLAGLPILMEERRGPITSDGRFDELKDSLLSSAFEADMVDWLLEGCSGVLTTILTFYDTKHCVRLAASRQAAAMAHLGHLVLS